MRVMAFFVIEELKILSYFLTKLCKRNYNGRVF
jgi:hypothetical protein